MRNFALALVVTFLVSAPVLAGNQSLLDTKYRFDGLESVDRLSLYRIKSWHALDNQSLIIRATPSVSYLVILRRPVFDLRFAHSIAFTSNGSWVHTRFDTIRVIDRFAVNMPVSIARIYKLEGKDQRKAVTAMIERS